jgi:hypothetical protein
VREEFGDGKNSGGADCAAAVRTSNLDHLAFQYIGNGKRSQRQYGDFGIFAF